ncbi:MAG: hypothetical protein AAGF74_06245 [Pseudomonadota bacterium]
MTGGALEARALSIADGAIAPDSGRIVDLDGYILAPGLVDLHAAPHTVEMPLGAPALDLDQVQQDAAAAGITTVWLGQRWPLSGQDARAALAALRDLRDARACARIDLRTQVIVDTPLQAGVSELILAIEQGLVDFLCIETGVTGAGKPALRPVASDAGGKERQSKPNGSVTRELCRIADSLEASYLPFGSFGDPDGDTRARFSMIGAKVAIAPQGKTAIRAAGAVGDPVVLRACGDDFETPGALHALVADAVEKRHWFVLASGKRFGATAERVWNLADHGVLDLPKAWTLASARPAKTMGLCDRGVLETGRRADVVVLNATTRQIEATIAGGRLVFQMGHAGRSLMAAAGHLTYAAE